MFIQLMISLLVSSTTACASAMDPAPRFYADIQDITHPTPSELQQLQRQLFQVDRPILKSLGPIQFIGREFKFWSDNPFEIPESGHFVVNTDDQDKRNCIVIYSSFNERYPQGVRRLAQAIKDSDYKGHVYYQIGGFPNIEGGDLRLVHVPFAFKVCFLKEMQAKGYESVLWMDSSLLPVPGMSLNLVFDLIRRLGIFIQAGDHTIGQFMNKRTAAAFGLSLEEASPLLSCSAAFVGVNFTKPRASALIDAWYRAAEHPFGFFSARADQNALSILIHQMGFAQDMLPRKLLGSTTDYSGAIFLMDPAYVKDERTH